MLMEIGTGSIQECNKHLTRFAVHRKSIKRHHYGAKINHTASQSITKHTKARTSEIRLFRVDVGHLLWSDISQIVQLSKALFAASA